MLFLCFKHSRSHCVFPQLLWAGLPGTEAGTALIDILYGDWNPSGKLPYTIAKAAEDYNAPLNMNATSGDLSIIRIPYEEGLEIDYRHFDAVSSCEFL